MNILQMCTQSMSCEACSKIHGEYGDGVLSLVPQGDTDFHGGSCYSIAFVWTCNKCGAAFKVAELNEHIDPVVLYRIT